MEYFERIAGEWRERAPELAECKMRCLINRNNFWRCYVDNCYREQSANHAITTPFRHERGKDFLNESSLENILKRKS